MTVGQHEVDALVAERDDESQARSALNQPDEAHRRRRGQSDAIDAEAAAPAVMSGRATAVAKTSDRHVERIRLFKLAEASATKARTHAINQLRPSSARRSGPARIADRNQQSNGFRISERCIHSNRSNSAVLPAL